MIDGEAPNELVQRLRQLRVSKGLTIQQMAETCGVPKSSLESYMRMSGAKRPGVDALISIADNMDVSLDWLVGRSNRKNQSENDKQRYALTVFDIVLELLRDIDNAEEDNTASIIQNGKIGGRSLEDFAARTMLYFTSRAALFDQGDGLESIRSLNAILDAAYERKPDTE